LKIEYYFIDSKQWQKKYLSSASIGAKEMKKASMEAGIARWPNNERLIRKHGDADGLFIALYAKERDE
jgi:hypothetical protein